MILRLNNFGMHKDAIITLCQQNSDDVCGDYEILRYFSSTLCKFMQLLMFIVRDKFIAKAKYQDQGYWMS